MATTILVVDDKASMRTVLRDYLAEEGFRVVTAENGRTALYVARHEKPDLILLDIMMPEMGGYEFLRAYRKERNTPVILLTARLEESDKVLGLELGADDYVTKPFSPRVLLARLRAVLRRRRAEPQAEADSLEFHELTIHSGRHEVLVQGQPVDLTSTEFRLLSFLARRPGWVFTRSQIVQGVQGDDYSVSERAVDVQIVGLRKKLGPAGKYVETVRGVGYRFKE